MGKLTERAQAFEAAMGDNPMSKALWEAGKASMQQACEEFNIQYPDINSLLSDTIGRFQCSGADPGMPGGLEAMMDSLQGFSLDGAMDKLDGVAENLGNAMQEIGECMYRYHVQCMVRYGMDTVVDKPEA